MLHTCRNKEGNKRSRVNWVPALNKETGTRTILENSKGKGKFSRFVCTSAPRPFTRPSRYRSSKSLSLVPYALTTSLSLTNSIFSFTLPFPSFSSSPVDYRLTLYSNTSLRLFSALRPSPLQSSISGDTLSHTLEPYPFGYPSLRSH